MAAATENGGRYVDYWGRTPVEIVDVTISNTNTFDTQFAAVKAFIFSPTTAVDWGGTISGGRITFVLDGTMTGKLFVFGDGE